MTIDDPAVGPYYVMQSFDVNGKPFDFIEQWRGIRDPLRVSANPFEFSQPWWGWQHGSRQHWWGIDDSLEQMERSVNDYFNGEAPPELGQFIWQTFTFGTL